MRKQGNFGDKVFLRRITVGAVAVALAVVLQFLKLWQMPQGGSISLEMIPLLFVALREGPGSGTVAGLVFGLIKLLLEPYIVHPLQLVLDYPLAFAVLGVAGFFRSCPWLGVLIGVFGRFVSHVVSGVVFFASYAPQGMSPLVYSLMYNATYLVPELVLALIITHLLEKRQELWRQERSQ